MPLIFVIRLIRLKNPLTAFQCIRIALIFSIILIGCDQNPETPPLTEETQVSGIIDTDTVWTKEHSPYIVTGDITGTECNIDYSVLYAKRGGGAI